jgi:hypothetical protein
VAKSLTALSRIGGGVCESGAASEVRVRVGGLCNSRGEETPEGSAVREARRGRRGSGAR